MANSEITILRWIGHACYVLTSPGGANILIDPVPADMGYPVTDVPAIDAVLVSHEHLDHNNVELAPGHPKVVRGSSARGWHPGELSVEDVKVRVIAGAYHDESQGAERGRTAIFSLQTGGFRLLHLGDLGHRLDTNLIAQCSGHDVVCIPIGGHFTIDAEAARDVVDTLRPSIVIPMHYKTDRLGSDAPISGLDDSGFLADAEVERSDTPSIHLSTAAFPTAQRILVLQTP